MNNTIDANIELLMKCDDSYFNGDEPILTDGEYDRLRRDTFKLAPQHEYFTVIGSDVRGGKVALPYQMGSLNQIYVGDVGPWVNKYSLKTSKIIASDKLDGTSCMVVYNNGKFSVSYSRGNGIEGADNTRHLKQFPSLPLSINGNYLVVRGECIMKNETFNEKYASEFKNPRNMVSGVLNRKETDLDILEDIEFISYEIVASDSGFESLSKTAMLAKLKEFGFLVAHSEEMVGGDMTDESLTDALYVRKSASKYELDGLVLTVDDHASLVLQSASSSLNPEHSVKYKVLDENSIVETYVTNVLWEVSKSAFIKPRVEIVPVELFGTTVTYASGFNAKYIIDNGIGKGAKIRITKSGMVIPFIVSVETRVAPALPDSNVFGEWEFNESGVEAVLRDKNAEPVVFKQVLDFFERYKIDLLKEANLKAIWNHVSSKTFDNAVIEIASLTAPELKKIIGSNGVKIAESMATRLTSNGIEVFLGASKHMGIGFGVRKAKALIAGMKNPLTELEDITIEDITEKEGFDVKTATMIVSGLADTLDLLNRMIDLGLIELKEKVVNTSNYDLDHLNIVMTGFRDAKLQDAVESRGGKVSSGISKKTTHLLCLDPSSTSGKMQKARDLGVTTITPDDFKLEFNI